MTAMIRFFVNRPVLAVKAIVILFGGSRRGPLARRRIPGSPLMVRVSASGANAQVGRHCGPPSSSGQRRREVMYMTTQSNNDGSYTLT
jgi:hypothetical protein